MKDIFDISYNQVNIIKSLWEENRVYHEKISEYFPQIYMNIDFYKRIKEFSIFSADEIKITVAKNNDRYIGYCISSVLKERGEVQSLYVSESERGSGIGKELILRHLEWMKNMKCTVIGVNVSQENQLAINFYKKLGFFPNTLYMQQQ